MKKTIRIPYLLTGKKGMKKAVWRKFEHAKFAASFKESFREMGEWEVGVLEIEAIDGIEGHKLLRETIGKRLIEKYEIESN